MKKLLIIEDDQLFATSLVKAFSRRGYSCLLASSCKEALEIISDEQPTHLLMDLNLGDENTQDLIPATRNLLPRSRIVVLTGYGTIPSTVRAMKEGAHQYLCKPTTVDTIANALEEEVLEENPPLWDFENDHILKVLENCGGNISQAAKSLGLHRRTLQRRLKKIT